MTSSALELTLPTVDLGTTRRAVGSALGKLVSDLRRFPLAELEPPLRVDARTVLGLLGPLSRTSPGVVWSALRRPSVYVNLRLAADGGPSAAEPLRRGVATLALELAANGALSRDLVLGAPPSRVILRSRAAALTLDPTRPLMISTDARASQDGVERVQQRAFEALSPAIALALVDDNPLASVEAHPDKSGSELDLGSASVSEWVESLGDALDRVGRHLPLLREELELVLQQMVPVGTFEERHLSASYREALGTIYVSLHPDPLTMTEAVVHEAQHNKLNAFVTSEALLENSPEERYASPVRPDLRPLFGVLLAVHAFVPVALLYAAMREAGEAIATSPRAEARVTQILRGNQEGLVLLETHARPTPSGRALLEELRALHDASALQLRSPI